MEYGFDEVRYEEYGVHYSFEGISNDMTSDERCFVSGLIKYYKPHLIVEIGVAEGGGSANILNTIRDMDCKLISIDVLDVFYHLAHGYINVGEGCKKAFPDSEDQWMLITGKDPSECTEDVFREKEIDFAVIDTANYHPIETLNFLSIFPFLSDDAIVVLHDISLYLAMVKDGKGLHCMATRLLFSSVCADKIVPEFTGYPGYTNICAFRLNKETRRYIRNVIDNLFLPWEMFPGSIGGVEKIIAKYYDDSMLKLFRNAVAMNTELYYLDKGAFDESVKIIVNKDRPYLYGAGCRLKSLLEGFDFSEMVNDIEVLDANSKEIKEINGVSVYDPNVIKEHKERPVVVTIESDMDYEIIKNLYKDHEVIHGWWNYLAMRLMAGSYD